MICRGFMGTYMLEGGYIVTEKIFFVSQAQPQGVKHVPQGLAIYHMMSCTSLHVGMRSLVEENPKEKHHLNLTNIADAADLRGTVRVVCGVTYVVWTHMHHQQISLLCGLHPSVFT